MIDLDGKALLEIFVKYEKIGWWSFLVYQSAKKGLFGLKRVGHTSNDSFEAGWRTLLVHLKIYWLIQVAKPDWKFW